MEQNDKIFAEQAEVSEAEDDTEVFASYYKPLAPRTRKRQWGELASLRAFLLEQGFPAGNLATDASSWSEMKGDLISAYVLSLKEQHYTASSITMQLYTIKTYARLAMENGKLPKSEYEHIQNIQTPSDTEGEPRRGEKRGQYLELTDEQVQQLLTQPDTQRGRRDRLLLALLLFCGLWPREIAALDRHSIDINTKTVTFYDYNAEEQQTLPLDPTTLQAAKQYLKDSSPYEALFVGNHKDSTHTLRLTDRAINDRVRALGEKINLKVLAPQDCHAYWEKHPSVTRRSHRKQRPDIFNRRAFEELMKQNGVEDSMLAPFVSDSRLILPWAIEFISQQELQQEFLQYIAQKLPEYGLKQSNSSFYEETLGHLVNWMGNELAKYRNSRK